MSAGQKNQGSTPQGPERRPPWVKLAVVLSLFLVIVLVSVFTVLIPEITDEPEPETEETSSAPAEP